MDEKESILIVDDDESTCKSLDLIFRKKGYKTETAGSGKEALDKARARFFNLAILDIRLPDMEGVELLAPFKEKHPDMVIIMATAYASVETAVRALNEGASAYITKPLNMDEVLATVREALEKQRLVREKRKAEEKVKASLKEKEVLLKEIHHRVKNNLQIISSLLHLQSDYIKNKKVSEMFKTSRDRIRSMSLIHEKLYQSENLAKIDFAQYIKSLAVHLFHSYKVGAKGIRLKTDIDDVFLDINTAIPCGLIINELVSNSLKHAFPQGKKWGKGGESKGEIFINLGSDKEGQFTLVVSDNGVGLLKGLDFRKTESLGLQLVNDLVNQLNGSIEVKRRGGTAFKITFNVPK